MRIAAFAAEAAFLPALARAWLAACASAGGEAADGVIVLPSRRAARSLAGAFLQENGGRALLLPRIIALGSIDEAGLALGGGLELPPAIPAMERQAILARLILGLEGRNGAPRRLAAAWALAGDLAVLLDEADYAGTDLAATMPGVVGAALAAHWQTTLEFLNIVTHAWPAILAERGMLNPAARQVALIEAQGVAWRGGQQRVWLVAREASPALARLARVVAGLAQGCVVLPGYDFAMDEAAWAAVDDGHAQSGIATLLGAMGARRDEVMRWGPAGGQRGRLLSRALLPGPALAAWQSGERHDSGGLWRLAAGDEQEEAVAIAMVLRQALEAPGRSAALITPDRALAQGVAAALQRFGVTVDDSAGEALLDTPPAVFLRLLARAAAAAFAPLPLLALLQHPLAAGGLPPERFRELARRLALRALRGPRPEPGFDGLRYRLDQRGEAAAQDYLERLRAAVAPVEGLMRAAAVTPEVGLAALLEAGEALAATAEETGAARLWAQEAGAALAVLLETALAALHGLPAMPPGEIGDLFEALLAGQVVRRPRTRDAHPRVAIWGVQEAALQTVDVAVLGGLVEGVWPAAAEPGPWLSRPMRAAAGLPPAERLVGAAAHDFFALAARCGEVVLAAPRRRERAPAVPARWITRLEAMLGGLGGLPAHAAAGWVRQLDVPAVRLRRPPPAPRPPVALRPKMLSVSDFATLLADPYAIYVKHVLDIRRLEPLDEESDPSRFGNIVHAGLAAYFAPHPDVMAPAAAVELARCLEVAMRQSRPRAALAAWWGARLRRIAVWVIGFERERRAGNPLYRIGVEIGGELAVAGGYVLKARADRIERRADGGIGVLDYKTGKPPTASELESGARPQLPLEAVIAEAGAFGEDFAGTVSELAFWQLSGRHEPGVDRAVYAGDAGKLQAVIARAAASLPLVFGSFARLETAYLAAPHPGRMTFDDPFGGISRRGEWAGAGDDDAG